MNSIEYFQKKKRGTLYNFKKILRNNYFTRHPTPDFFLLKRSAMVVCVRLRCAKKIIKKIFCQVFWNPTLRGVGNKKQIKNQHFHSIFLKFPIEISLFWRIFKHRGLISYKYIKVPLLSDHNTFWQSLEKVPPQKKPSF